MPDHWTLASIRHLLSKVEQGWSPECESRPASDAEWGVLKAGCANGGVFREEENKTLPPSLTPVIEYEVRAGDVLMSRAIGSAENVGATAFVERTRPRLLLSDKIFRLHPTNRVLPQYLAILLGSGPLRLQIERSISGADGLANNLPQSALKAFRCVVPPLDEQLSILSFVNSETAKIDALVEEQWRLIELLKEKRQAVISHAVTKGLDPTAPMKDSSVEWLGQVPEHWEVKRLKYLGEAIIGLTYAPENVTDDSGTLVLRSSNVQVGKIALHNNVYVNVAPPDELITRAGDILICSRNGSRALIGKNARIETSSAGMTFGAFMTIYRSPFNDYLTWVFNSFLFEAQSGAFMSSTIQSAHHIHTEFHGSPLPARERAQGDQRVPGEPSYQNRSVDR